MNRFWSEFCFIWKVNYLAVSNLSHREIENRAECGSCRCSNLLDMSRNQRSWYVFDPGRRITRWLQHSMNRHQTQDNLYSFDQAPQWWHENFNTFLPSHELTESAVNSNDYLCSDSILILLYIDNVSLSYLQAPTQAEIEVKGKFSEKCKITNISLACQFLRLQIYSNGARVSLRQKAYITTILRHFGLKRTHSVSTPIDLIIIFHFAEDQGEMELNDITGNEAVIGSLMDSALATCPDRFYAVADLSCYNLRPFTIHITAAKRVLRYFKYTTNF